MSSGSEARLGDGVDVEVDRQGGDRPSPCRPDVAPACPTGRDRSPRRRPCRSCLRSAPLERRVERLVELAGGVMRQDATESFCDPALPRSRRARCPVDISPRVTAAARAWRQREARSGAGLSSSIVASVGKRAAALPPNKGALSRRKAPGSRRLSDLDPAPEPHGSRQDDEVVLGETPPAAVPKSGQYFRRQRLPSMDDRSL